MLHIDTTDCWLEIGVGKNFMRSLVWHFSRFIRENPSAQTDVKNLAAESIDREARRLAGLFASDMQTYFRKNLADTFEVLENLSPEGIVELYLQENLDDFEADYLSERASIARKTGDTPPRVVAPVDLSVVAAPVACH